MIAFRSTMDNHRLDKLIRRHATDIEGQLGFWRFTYGDRTLLVITDESHDRMRVMTPVVDESELQSADLSVLLAANFDRALDAKYALSDGHLWSVFVHPLGSLVDAFFIDAMDQVGKLADNYGSTYASSDLFFGGE